MPENSIRYDQASALYVHVPFCRQKCSYCDFYSLPDSHNRATGYLRGILAELQQQRHQLTIPLQSIFLGGGTPTALPLDTLTELLGILGDMKDADTEFSIEANPATLSPEMIDVLVAAGVNRVNVGVQSFQDQELQILNRVHDAATAHKAVAMLREAGIASVGLDLIYAIPTQTLASWKDSLQQALSLNLDHLSCYALTLEEGTPLDDAIRAGTYEEMDESLQLDCFQTAIEYARHAGLEHYEISNFAAKGKRCRHNLTYWHNRPYIGLGPAAASYVDRIRSTNTPDLDAWQEAMLEGKTPPRQQERLTGMAEMAETAMLALRMIDGLDRAEFRQRFGVDITEVFGPTIDRYFNQGALRLSASSLRIASWALFTSNTILADLLDQAE